jgi:serine O-acetyltransferase
MPRPTFSTTLTPPELCGYVTRLVTNYLPDGAKSAIDLQPQVRAVLGRVEHCFSQINRKYYTLDNRVTFDHLNSDHMAAFLYFLGNTIWKSTGDTALPTRLFYLNKAMHGLDLYFSVALPEVFLLVHPVGTVIGNATYGNYFAIYQNCTTGADGGIYPTFGEGTIMYSRTSVLGNSTIGDDVVFAANSFVVNSDVPSSSLVVGQFPQHRLLVNTVPVRDRLFESAPKGG